MPRPMLAPANKANAEACVDKDTGNVDSHGLLPTPGPTLTPTIEADAKADNDSSIDGDAENRFQTQRLPGGNGHRQRRKETKRETQMETAPDFKRREGKT